MITSVFYQTSAKRVLIACVLVFMLPLTGCSTISKTFAFSSKENNHRVQSGDVRTQMFLREAAEQIEEFEEQYLNPYRTLYGDKVSLKYSTGNVRKVSDTTLSFERVLEIDESPEKPIFFANSDYRGLDPVSRKIRPEYRDYATLIGGLIKSVHATARPYADRVEISVDYYSTSDAASFRKNGKIHYIGPSFSGSAKINGQLYDNVTLPSGAYISDNQMLALARGIYLDGRIRVAADTPYTSNYEVKTYDGNSIGEQFRYVKVTVRVILKQ